MPPAITFYFKPFCPWCAEVREVLKRHNIPADERNVIKDPAMMEEMVRRTGQDKAPCVDIDGHMLVDVGGKEVEAYLKEKGHIKGK